MTDPQSNYLKNTIPELEDQFVEEIGKIPLFSRLSKQLQQQLFQYAKFVKLRPREYVIEQGMFDQEIFVLLEGKLVVFIQDDLGNEVIIDVMGEPFTLFGERSLLGEPRGASIQAEDSSLLLGIDLSSLPDILEGFDSPENRQEDEVYAQNLAMYTVFATVLTQRLERLVRDQYKLRQKIGEFQKRQSSWTREWLLSRTFNQIHSDELPLNPEVREILNRKFKKYRISHPSLLEIINSQTFSTRQLYMEMVRLHTLGDLDNIHHLIFDFVSDLATLFYNHSDYTNLFEISLLEVHDIPEMTPLSDFFNSLYDAIPQDKILAQPLPKEKYLDAILSNNNINPIRFAEVLQKDGWIENNFSLAYIVYLICQQSIYSVSKANNIIGDYVQFLSTYSTPKQTSQTSLNQSSDLIHRFTEMQKKHEANLSSEDPSQEAGSPQDDADELLKSLGL